MSPKEVFDHFGGIAETARSLGISYEAARKWSLSGRVPKSRQYEIQIKTGGDLKAVDTKAA